MLSDFFDVSKIVAFLVLVFMVGCSVLDNHQASAKLAVQYATLKYIDGDAHKRERVIVQVARAEELANVAASLDALADAVRQEIPFDEMDAADAVLVNGLVDALEEELKARFPEDDGSGGVLDPEQIVAVKSVLGWIYEAAHL